MPETKSLSREQVEELLEFGKDMGSFDIKMLDHDAAQRTEIEGLRLQLKGVEAVRDEYYASLNEALESEERLLARVAEAQVTITNLRNALLSLENDAKQMREASDE